MLHQQVGRGGGRCLHAVEHDHVGARLAGELDVLRHAAGAYFDVDGDAAIGGLTQLLDLDHQIVGTDPVGVAHG